MRFIPFDTLLANWARKQLLSKELLQELLGVQGANRVFDGVNPQGFPAMGTTGVPLGRGNNLAGALPDVFSKLDERKQQQKQAKEPTPRPSSPAPTPNPKNHEEEALTPRPGFNPKPR